MNRIKSHLFAGIFASATLFSCQPATTTESQPAQRPLMIGDTTLRAELFVDPHSFSTAEATVTHLEWDAKVDFEAQEIHATAVWTLSELHGDQIVFDTKALEIKEVLLDGQEAHWSFGKEDDLLGSALVVYDLSPASKQVAITYTTTEGAEAV